MGTAIVSALVPVFFVMALGFLAGRKRIIDNTNVLPLNVLVMDFALPASLFTAIARTPRNVVLGQGKLFVVLALSMLVVYVATWVQQRSVFQLSAGDSAVQTLTVALPNFASVGLPLLGSVFGPDSAVAVAVAIAAGATVISPLTLVILERSSRAEQPRPFGGRLVQATLHSLRKPVVLGPLAGATFVLSGVHIPDLVGKMLTLIGQSTAGTALFLTGVIMSAHSLKVSHNVLFGVALKNGLQAIIALGLVQLLRMDQPAASEAVLLVAIPAGFFGTVFGNRYGLSSIEACSTLIASSVLSVITLAVTIFLITPAK